MLGIDGDLWQLILLFTGLGLAAFSVYLFTQSVVGSDSDADQLAWASGDEPAKSKSDFINYSRPLVHNFALKHTKKVKSESYRAKVKKKILNAGLSREINVDEFIGLQILWGVQIPIAVAVLDFALGLEIGTFMIVGGAAIGAYFPHLYCASNKNQRYLSVVSDLPFYVDLLALSSRAGLDFVNAIQRIVDKSEPSVLNDELAIVLKDIKLGSSRAEALRALSDRLDIPEVTSFVSVVVDSDDTGASIFEVLQEQSAQMRMERFTRAEKAGAKASQTMLIPMMIFILPAVFIVVFAPAIIAMVSGGN
ncbi:MAG: pilus assembly protein TadC [Bdellovibrionaceae bacterium]|nr:pilus assembly protein TadC [Pseudobdellovibrionaceae bacterium]|tara:strand:- start:157109 stop:158029 length:921 start_codon:yes stop_codon:yes gene_type:complete